MRVCSSAPTRLDLAGGTLDIWPLYLFHDGAQTLNAALTIRAECVLSNSEDGAWHIVSEDSGATLSLGDLFEGSIPEGHRLTLRILRYFRPGPVRLVTRSGSPIGAGLAGSSAMNIALCAALARYTDTPYTPDSLMSLAQNLEAQVIGVPTGAQDYRPAVYGGVAAVELSPGGVKRTQLDLDPRDLEQRIVLAYTGQSRDSGFNNWEVTKRHIDGDLSVAAVFEALTDVAIVMRQALEAKDWPEVSTQILREWQLRKRLAPGVTTPDIERLIASGVAAGALAAKVCGAGGGGCILFFSHPSENLAIRTALTNAGARVLDAGIDVDGLQVESG